MTPADKLRTALDAPGILIAPGVFDAMSAHLAAVAGFRAVFASGSALAATHLARPDIGLLSLAETAEIVARIADRIDIPVLVDADQGGGNAWTVARHVRMLEKAGAAAVQIEDQAEVRPADAPLSRPLIPTQTMVGKIKAAKDAVQAGTLISARTDAAHSEGAQSAIERAVAYAEAGADIVFAESLTRQAEMHRLTEAIGDKAPLLHNLLRPNDEVNDAATLEAIGYKIALFPAPAMRAAAAAMAAAFDQLAADPRVADEGPAPDWIGGADFLRG